MTTRKLNINNQHYCVVGCDKIFQSPTRAINSHWQKRKECSEACNLCQDNCNQDINSNDIEGTDTDSSIDFDTTVEIGDENEPPSCDISGDQEQGTQNGLSNAFDNNGNGSSLPAKIELLKILNTVKAPHNLNDYIMGWAKTAVSKYDVDFGIEPFIRNQNKGPNKSLELHLITPLLTTISMVLVYLKKRILA